jgi:nitrilase
VTADRTLRVAAVQASYVLMDRDATIDKVAALTAEAAANEATLVVFPEAFVPGTPLWIDTRPIWDGDGDWYRLLVENAIVVGDAACTRLGAIAAENNVGLVIGVQERERNAASIYDTTLYFSPEGELVQHHRKLVPTGSERTVWTPGDGSTLDVVNTGQARIGGLICWENYMPLARFYIYSQGVDVWLAPTLAVGDAWISTMQHIARENRMFVIGVNPVLHKDMVPADFPDRDRLLTAAHLEEHGDWLEEGNTVIVNPAAELVAGPIREREETVYANLDLGMVASARRFMDPAGHYNRPDVFQLLVDTRARSAVQESQLGGLSD